MNTVGEGRALGYVECAEGRLNGPKKRPFYRAKLDQSQSAELLTHLRNCAQGQERQWYILTATSEAPKRLRLFTKPTPEYEVKATMTYARGEAFRVSGRSSVNIEFSAKVGAPLLAERLASAMGCMRRFLMMQVPNRGGKRNLIEFIPDTEIEAQETEEHRKLALTGEALAGDVFTENEFADWERLGA